MPRTQHSHHFLYKTTCLITKKFYYGMHSTSDLEDGYIGSGKRLWLSINKHGKDNHRVEILQFFDSREALVQGEIKLITDGLLKDPMCMNLVKGGEGGNRWKFVNRSDVGRKGGVAKFNKHKDEVLKVLRENREKFNLKLPLWNGKSHTEETKQRMRLIKMNHGAGETNSQFGTMWIHNVELNQNKKIKTSDISQYPNWNVGRKMKF